MTTPTKKEPTHPTVLRLRLSKCMEVVSYVAKRKHCKSLAEFCRAIVDERKKNPGFERAYNDEMTYIYNLAKDLVKTEEDYQ